MRLLLIAWEFPPSPSPQSLRWSYLCRELARAGHEVHVLTTGPDRAVEGLPELPGEVVVHRLPGPYSRLMAMLWRRQQARAAARAAAPVAAAASGASGAPGADAATSPAAAGPLNWKGRLLHALQRTAEHFLFPDVRGEWYFPARRRIAGLVREVRPDVVVSSHEPATTLQLGLLVKRRFGLPWIADLGDPVLADYTPARWRRKSLRLERRVMALADAVTVTAPGTRDLLRQRHGAAGAAIEVLPQGFEDRPGDLPPSPAGFDPARLELLYTGSFYRFRRPDALLDAVARVPGARLSIAASSLPPAIAARVREAPERFRALGFLPHRDALALQRGADVLVDIANDNPCQVPGKFYEYLGAGRPVLHLGPAGDDEAAAALLRERRRGWNCANEREAIEALLRSLAGRKAAGLPVGEGLDLAPDAIAEFGWSRLALRFAALAQRVAAAENGRAAPVMEH